MNKFLKLIIIFLGATNAIFSIAMPLFVSLLLLTIFKFTELNQLLLMVAGLSAALYRAVKFWVN